jgi:glycosyltransferase involved in cell wall biosynthesis
LAAAPHSRPSVALVCASARTDGICYAARNIRLALQELSFKVVWYQCVDRGQDWKIAEMDHAVPGLGVPNATIDMGLNRQWIFPLRLRHIQEQVVLLMDPTLINVARFHPRTVVRVFDLKPLTAHADRQAATWMFRYALPRLRRVPRILVPSNHLAQELAGQGIAAERIRVLPETHALGFHPDHIATSLERIRNTGVVRVIYVATDRPYKNVRFVIRLAERAAKSPGSPTLQFTIVSRLHPETLALVSNLNLPNLTVTREALSMAEVYAANDVLVFPSLHEGFGLPVIEAMAFGLPVVATNVAPLTEVIADGGTLLDPSAPGPWMESLRGFSNPSVYETAARRSFARGENFSPARFREAVDRAFDGI